MRSCKPLSVAVLAMLSAWTPAPGEESKEQREIDAFLVSLRAAVREARPSAVMALIDAAGAERVLAGCSFLDAMDRDRREVLPERLKTHLLLFITNLRAVADWESWKLSSMQIFLPTDAANAVVSLKRRRQRFEDLFAPGLSACHPLRLFFVRTADGLRLVDIEDLERGVRFSFFFGCLLAAERPGENRLGGESGKEELLALRKAMAVALEGGEEKELAPSLARAGGVLPGPLDAARRVLGARKHILDGRYEGALALLEHAGGMRDEPLQVSRTLRAQALFGLERYEEALEAAEWWRMAVGYNAGSAALIAASQEKLGRPGEAREALQRGLESDPSSPELLIRLWRLLEPPERPQLLEYFDEPPPDRPERLLNFLKDVFDSEDVTGAEAFLERLTRWPELETESDANSYHWWNAEVRYRRRDYAGALPLYEAIRARREKEGPDERDDESDETQVALEDRLIRCRLGLGLIKEALEEARKSTVRDDCSWFEVLVHLRAGDFQAASRAVERCAGKGCHSIKDYFEDEELGSPLREAALRAFGAGERDR